MADEQQQRASSSSTRSSSGRSKQNPQQQLSTIEKSVTHLLVATKQLLETLTMWSRGAATETEVSDVYVRLGYEFNIACRAFNAIGVETADLGPVPDLLRAILEDTLSQEASQASLDKFLPRIRDIIINLLHGLKKKQQKLRQKSSGGGGGTSASAGGETRLPRQASTASTMSVDSNLTQQLEELPARSSSSRSYVQRSGSSDMQPVDLPPRTTSVPSGRSPTRKSNLSPQNSVHQSQSVRDDSSSSYSSSTMQNIPVIAPYPEDDTIPTNGGYQPSSASPEPPLPPPKQNDALQALQRGGDLERRASRRFSAYQIQKHLGPSINGIGAIPPAQHSPVPNRGRDVRESMNAVRTRGSLLHGRARSRTEQKPTFEPSPSRLHDQVRRISEEPSNLLDEDTVSSQPPHPDEQRSPDDEIVKTPEDKIGQHSFFDNDRPQATLNGPVAEPFAPDGSFQDSGSKISDRRKSSAAARNLTRQAMVQTPPPSQQQYIPETSPQPGKELTLFLQYKTKIKKFVLPDGGDLTLPRLQLAFIEKFAWNTHTHGELPEIYVQDPVSGVRHELEDITDIKERSVLVLNVEALDEVKRHIDDGLGGIRRIVEGIKTSVDDQAASIQRVSDRQQETAKELASIAAAPATISTAGAGTAVSRTMSIKDKAGQLTEIQRLRRDLAVVRQTYTSFVSDMNASMATIRTKAVGVKAAAQKAIIPDMDSDTGRSYVNNGKKNLSDDSEKIVNRVDDLQDTVEDLRKDVVTRGVRPLPRQLETVSKDISTATADLAKLQEFLKREKPVWTKIWEKELQVVCDDRDLLTMQEELAADLEDDLEKAAATFALVEQATKQQNLQNPTTAANTNATSRSSSRGLNPVALGHAADPLKAKDGVLGEVRALQPNHESRLEAIERAEKARQRELESRRGGEFQQELGKFVEQEKLKKSGGVEEVERRRLAAEERARRANFETQIQRERARAEKAGARHGGGGGGGDSATEKAADSGLDVPAQEENVPSSPEPEFVEAKEVTSPVNGD